MKLLRQRFEDALGPDAAKMVDISTIDGFQVLAAAEYTHADACCDGRHTCQWWELLMVCSSWRPDAGSC